MSLLSLLSIARSALLTQKRAMEVTAHNVANAQTPGYSRQRLSLRTEDSLYTPQGSIGRGVTADGVRRSRDLFYDATFRRESGLFSQSSTLFDGLKQIEGAMSEPSELGLSATLDKMFHAFADLANDPASPANRDLAWQAANRLTQQMNQLDRRINDVAGDARLRLQGQAGEANELLRRIADLNRRILGGGGNAATDLQDARDSAIDRLSELMSVKVLGHDDGTVTLLGEGTTLVDRINATQLSVSGSGSNVSIQDAAGGTIAAPGGSMGALIEITNVRVPAIRAQLDQLAAALVAQVNAVHRTGYTAAGATNTDFFDPAGVTAGTIRLAAPVLASSAAIAAGATNRAGDGAIAQLLAELAETAIGSLSGRTFREHYAGVATGVGLSVQGLGADADVQLALVDQADQRRTAVSGVSVDEEMVNLLAQQQAYGAAAKLISAADEMFRVLLESM